MADKEEKKTALESSRDIISQLKEIQHYSEENIEKLTEFWLLFDGELKNKPMAATAEELLLIQNKFHDALTAAVSDFEMECNRVESEN